MYSVVNAIAGHYISFGPTYPIPVKRKDRILDEVKDAEKALSRGR
jgi:photosystem II Psb27 protein